MKTVTEIMQYLESKADPAALQGMAHFGMSAERRLGIKVPDMRSLAKMVGKDHALALQLWDTGVAEARILAGMIADPGLFTEAQADAWVKDIDSWDICDQLCMNLLEKTPFAVRKIHEWSQRDEEFVKRTAYALIACLAWHDKKAPDAFFIDLLPVIERGADDERNFVKKAVNWALRNIGKRNLNLNKQAILSVERVNRMESKAARWIATDALRELRDEKVQVKLR